MRKLLAAVIAVAVLLGACENPLSISGKRPIEPEPHWADLAVQMEDCLRRAGWDNGLQRTADDFREILWFAADDIQHEDRDGVVGGVFREPKTIILHDPTGLDDGTVSHELIHWLIQGGDDHPESAFQCTDARWPA